MQKRGTHDRFISKIIEYEHCSKLDHTCVVDLSSFAQKSTKVDRLPYVGDRWHTLDRSRFV